MSIAETRSTDWPELHRRAVDAFARGWESPHPHAWDDLLHPLVRLHQPLLADGHGRSVWQEELARLLAFLPDLRGEVTNWAGHIDVVYIDIACTATSAGRPLRFRTIDRLIIDTDGKIRERDSFLDPTPLILTIAGRPRAWPRWWRSGIGPFASRRHIFPRKG